MKQTRIMMGMPITVEILDPSAGQQEVDDTFDYFTHVDEVFSTYKDDSEISRINRGEIIAKNYSEEMHEIFSLSEETKQQTGGYFDIKKADGTYDPSGIVKGWAIQNAAQKLKNRGLENFYIEAGGDIQVSGRNSSGKPWSVGIRNPFAHDQIVKTLCIENEGMATSGTYIRGQHIYNPMDKNLTEKGEMDIISLTVIGPNIYDADRFATAAFAMGRKGIEFIEKLGGFEGYMINSKGIATMTTGFERYTTESISTNIL